MKLPPHLLALPSLLARVWRLVEAYWRKSVRLPETARDCQRLHSLWTLQAWPEASHHPQPFYVTPIKENGEWRAPGFLPLHNPIDINMMPFVAEADFESCRLPEFVRPYWGLILACLAPEIERSVSDLWPIRSLPSRRGAVCYLTIQESQV